MRVPKNDVQNRRRAGALLVHGVHGDSNVRMGRAGRVSELLLRSRSRSRSGMDARFPAGSLDMSRISSAEAEVESIYIGAHRGLTRDFRETISFESSLAGPFVLSGGSSRRTCV